MAWKARTHLRFGTCERRLRRHVVAVCCPHLSEAHPIAPDGRAGPQLLAFYGELVVRRAAAWRAAGFTQGVLNTDTMSLVGERFADGPFTFLDRWDPGFTAACFDHSGLYAHGRQPGICRHNLRLLQEPLALLLPRKELEAHLERFGPTFENHHPRRMRRRLGLTTDRCRRPTPRSCRIRFRPRCSGWPPGRWAATSSSAP